jgi:hypothetical protein
MKLTDLANSRVVDVSLGLGEDRHQLEIAGIDSRADRNSANCNDDSDHGKTEASNYACIIIFVSLVALEGETMRFLMDQGSHETLQTMVGRSGLGNDHGYFRRWSLGRRMSDPRYRAFSLHKAATQSLVVLSATAGSRALDPLIAIATIPVVRIKPTMAFAFSQRSNVRWSAGDMSL